MKRIIVAAMLFVSAAFSQTVAAEQRVELKTIEQVDFKIERETDEIFVETPGRTDDAYWHKDPKWVPPKYKPLIMEVAKMPVGTDCEMARGCYVYEQCDPLYPLLCTPAQILVAMRLPPWVKQCILRHEYEHHKGKLHDKDHSECR